MSETAMIERKSWKEFRDFGLLWWVNRALHLMGWAIVYEFNDSRTQITHVYPARVKFRGFSPDVESEGYKRITNYLHQNAEELLKESEK